MYTNSQATTVSHIENTVSTLKYGVFTSYFAGTTAPKPRWEYCFNSVDSYMSLALGALYIKNNFRNKTKDQVSWMVDEFQSTIKDTIDTSSWLEEEAEEKASAKVHVVCRPIFSNCSKRTRRRFFEGPFS
jgi:predicted metalloendopeptidase